MAKVDFEAYRIVRRSPFLRVGSKEFKEAKQANSTLMLSLFIVSKQRKSTHISLTLLKDQLSILCENSVKNKSLLMDLNHFVAIQLGRTLFLSF